MKINLYLLTILFFTLLSCGDENSDSNDVDPVEEVQIELGKTNQTIEHNGITRTYVQYVPNSYNHENPTPLVINFHGNGGDAQAYADSTGDFQHGPLKHTHTKYLFRCFQVLYIDISRA